MPPCLPEGCGFDSHGTHQSGLGVPTDPLSVTLGEQVEHFSRISMPTGIGFRVEDLTVDGHVEDSLGTRGEGQRLDDVLIVVEKI